MAKSSFFSGTGTTPTNVESVSSSKAAAEASENAAAASAAAAAQSATQAGTSNAAADTAKVAAQAAQTAAETAETNAAASAASIATSETNAAASATAAAASETAAAASATAAGNSQVSATQSANVATTKATEASTSATSAATSATNASASETAAAASETAAAASETAAAASETAASASETAAAASETAAATSETNAASSATSASTSATTATTQATNAANSATQAASSATSAATSETNASASETAAAASETAAATSETNAANSATASATSATNSATSATASANSATAAAGSASAASTSATDAATSASDAATSETNASNSATAASNSASAASTSETNAGNSATNAATSATAASNSATAAAASETAAASSESAAATSETNAATSASNASSSASAASGSATTASTQATNASNSATAAATSETNAANSATASANSASAASTSATAAASSASSAQASKDAALAALDNFDDRYLGQKANDPSTDNDGNALVSGALYFNTTSDIMKVYDGSAWVAAYASLSGTLTAANNLSDLDNASDARTNLGLAIGTDVQAYSATLAGTTASYTTAEETKLAGIETGATADQTAAEIRSLVESATDSNVFTDADHTKLNGIESGATADQSAAEILTAIKTVDGSGSGLDADTLDGSHASAFLTGNQTITLTGDASGSGTTSINVTVANDSHTHDGRYYTESEADSRFVNVTGDTISGTLTLSQDGQDVLNFSANDTNDARGISFNSRTALSADYNDGYLRLNQLSEFSNGVYSPSRIRADGGFTVGNNTTYVWHQGNDGSGSGLDADLLDGQHGSYYYPASNPNGYTTNVGDITGVTAGSGLTGGGTSGTATVSHAETSSQASVNNAGRTYIQDITLDTYGHITGITSATETVTNTDTIPNNATITLSAGTNLTGGGNFTTDQSANETITFNLTSSPSLNSVLIGSTVTLQESTDRADLLQITSSTAGWGGLQIRNSSNEGRWSFMTDGDTAGIYNDEDNQWHVKWVEQGNTEFYHNNAVKATITSTDWEMAQRLDMNNYDIYGVDQIVHHGDTNTYMQFHAADQWRVVVGGTERLEVKNSSPHVLVSGDLNSTSDERLKDNIKPITNALSDVTQLEGVTFDWKDTGTRGHGFIAQQVEPILPDLVNTDEDTGMKSVNYIGMIGHLVEAIKEQQEQIDALKEQLKS